MAYTKTIVCLAASRKPGGLCIAGKDIGTGEWIRPVSHREGEEISAAECTMTNGQQIRLLDIVTVPLLKSKPHRHQTENHLIDPDKRWKKEGRATWEQVEESLDDHSGPLWLNLNASGGYLYNRVHENLLYRFNDSLLLIRPKKLRISVAPKGGPFDDSDKRIVKAAFSHSGYEYRFTVTDRVFERQFKAGKDRTEDMTGSILCISLGEVNKKDSYAYKLAAAVIPPF